MMKFYIYSTSGSTHEYVKTFSSLEELMTFQALNGTIVIKDNYWYNEAPDVLISFHGLNPEEAQEIINCDKAIEIYDDYRE